MTDRRRNWLRRFGPATAAQMAEALGGRRETLAQWCRRQPDVEVVGYLSAPGAPSLWRLTW